MTDTSSKFFRPPTGEQRATYLHGFIDGCNAGREETLAVIASTKTETATLEPELERRRQAAEVEILEAEARLRKATAELRELDATRRKRAAEKRV